MKRIFLFIVTNLAVLALLSAVIFVVEQVFGLRLPQGGLGGLLVFAAVCATAVSFGASAAHDAGKSRRWTSCA